MTIKLTPLSLALALMAAPAIAQDGAGEAPEAEAPATEGAPGPDPDLGLQSMQTEQPQAFVRSENGDWQVQCIRFPDGTENQCQLFQLLDAGDGNPLAEAYFFKPPEGSQFAAGLNMVVPLRTLLSEPLAISIDGGQARRIPYMMCTGEGCVARAGITGEELALFRRGATATVTIVPADAPTERVSADMSLSGFTASFESLEPAQLPTQPGEGAAE